MKSIVKKYAKHGLSFISNVHRQSKMKNIFIFSTPRSGSTWLMEIIATQPGFKYYDEPFNIRRENVRNINLFKSWSELIDGCKNEDKILRYLKELERNNIKYMNPIPLRRNYRFFTNRIVFKIHEIEHMINIIKDNTDSEIIFLVRHPIATTVSRTTYPRLKLFVESKNFRDKYLSNEQIKYIKNIYNKGSSFERGILSWCFQNLVPLKHMNIEGWIIITYEELVLNADKICNYLYDKLSLSKLERMMSMVSLPATNIELSEKNTIDIVRSQNNKKRRSQLVTKWKKKVSAKEQEIAFEILSVFGIDIYKRESFTAIDKYLNFEDTKKLDRHLTT